MTVTTFDPPLRRAYIWLVPEGWLTVTQCAERKGLTTQQIRDAIKLGNLPAKKTGPIWLVRVEDIDAFEIKPMGRPKKPPKRKGRPPKISN